MRIAVVGASGLVGSALVGLAEAQGHAVIGLSTSNGADVLDPASLEGRLVSVDAVVDVTQSPTFEELEATEFFVRAAANLGRAAHEAGVQRSVVLSIIGAQQISEADVDAGTGFDGYYRAKFAHERATTEHAPGAHVVRSAQFHDIARQAIGWGRDGDRATVPDLLTQPVAVDALIAVVLAAASGALPGPATAVAGPLRERLGAMATAYAAHVGDPVAVTAAPVGDLVETGVLLPGEGAAIVGPTFSEWLAFQR